MGFENTFGPRPVPSQGECEAYAQGALPPGNMALLRAIQEKFLRTFAEELSIRLEMPATAQLAAAEPLSSSDFLESGDDGGCLLTFESAPVRGQVFISLSAGFVAYLLRVLLGAPATSGNPRSVTEIELHILREIFELLSRELSAAWQSAGIAFCWTPIGAPEPAGGPGTLLVFECRMDLDGGLQTFRVAVPALLARLAALYSAPAVIGEDQALVRETILGALRRANVTVEAVLTGSTLRMGDLLAMEPGHTLMLTQAAGSPVECRINGKAKFRGEWICRGNRQAIELL